MSDAAVAKKKEDSDYVTRRLRSEFPLFRGSVFGVNPFGLMRQFTDDMNRVFGFEANETAWVPPIEMKQMEGKLVLTADLPGLKREDVKVNVTENTLTLEGERKQEKEDKGEGYYHSERRYGKFFRSIPLPEGAKIDGAAAQFKDGVLEITVPIAAMKETAKQVPIK